MDSHHQHSFCKMMFFFPNLICSPFMFLGGGHTNMYLSISTYTFICIYTNTIMYTNEYSCTSFKWPLIPLNPSGHARARHNATKHTANSKGLGGDSVTVLGDGDERTFHIYAHIPSLKLTFSHLKMDGWFRWSFPYGAFRPIFRGVCC